jgi:hypothetical protein
MSVHAIKCTIVYDFGLSLRKKNQLENRKKDKVSDLIE